METEHSRFNGSFSKKKNIYILKFLSELNHQMIPY